MRQISDYYSSGFERSMNKKSRNEFHRVLGVYGTGDAVVVRIQDQLAEVTGKAAPVPIALIQKFWSDKPYHAGWHAWNKGARSWEVAGTLYARSLMPTCLHVARRFPASRDGLKVL